MYMPMRLYLVSVSPLYGRLFRLPCSGGRYNGALCCVDYFLFWSMRLHSRLSNYIAVYGRITFYLYCSFIIIFVLSHGGVLSQYRRAYQTTPLALLGLMPSVYETIVLACKGSHLEWFGNGCDLLAPHSPQPPCVKE